MKLARHLVLPMTFSNLHEAARAAFLGEGFEIEGAADGRVMQFKRDSGWLASFGWRVEKMRQHARVEVAEGLEGEDGGPRTHLAISWEIDTRFHFVSSVDLLYFELAFEDLEHYLRTGQRRSSTARLDLVRRPVVVAVLLNIFVSTVLIALVGRMTSMNTGLLFGVAMVVALLNLGAIMGFADVIVDGMRRLRDPNAGA